MDRACRVGRQQGTDFCCRINALSTAMNLYRKRDMISFLGEEM